MKKWMYTLICLGYLTPAFATDHTSFLIKSDALNEFSYYDYGLETPNIFGSKFPLDLNPDLVLVPRTPDGFDFGLEGYLLQPIDSQLDFAIIDPNSPFSPLTGSPSINSALRAINTGYQPAYGFHFGYVYPYSARTITLYFFGFNNNNFNNSDNAPLGGTIWTPLSLYRISDFATSARSQFTLDTYEANLLIGHHIFVGSRFHLHPEMGAELVRITRDVNTTYFNSSFQPVQGGPTFVGNTNVTQNSRFYGVGPEVKLDGTYYFTHHWGLVGRLNTAILVGNIKSHINSNNDSTSTSINLNSANRVVPNVEGRLGIKYVYPFRRSRLNIEAGYEFNHFFNAVDNFRTTSDPSFSPPFTPPVSLGTGQAPEHVKVVSDLNYNGPYLSIGLSGIACPEDVILDPILVIAPNSIGGFEFGIGAGYMRVQNNQQDFAISDPTPQTLANNFTFPSTASSLINVQSTSSNYGILGHAGYVFANTPYDARLNFITVQSSNSNSVTAPAGGVIWTILTVQNDSGVSPAVAQSATASMSFHYYAADLEVGQHVIADNLFRLRFFQGIQYAHINTDLNVTYNNESSLLGPSNGVTFTQENITQQSRFNGFGPRLGFGLDLPIAGFELDSTVAAGMLFGKLNSSYKDHIPNDSGTGGLEFADANLGVQVNSQIKTSPFLDLKIALSYTLRSFFNANWAIELGYLATHYFNAATTFRSANPISGATFIQQVDDVSIDGPYLQLTWSALGCNPCIPRPPFPVIVPVLRGGLEFAIEGILAEPRASNVDYAIVDPTPNFLFVSTVQDLAPSSNSVMHLIQTNHSLGVRLHAGYIFPLSANDIAANFYQFSKSNSESVTAPSDGVIWTNLAHPTSINFPIIAQSASGQVDFDFKGYNLEVGRRVNLYRFMTRFFAGLSYDNVQENITTVYSNAVTAQGDLIPTDRITQTNHFRGFGPRLGVDGDICLGYGFSLTGHIATNLLVGSLNSDLTEKASTGIATTLDPGSDLRAVPTVDGKIGLALSVPLINCSSVSLEGGYEFTHYFRVKDSFRYTNDFGSAHVKQDQGLGFDGPYLRLQFNWGGNCDICPCTPGPCCSN